MKVHMEKLLFVYILFICLNLGENKQEPMKLVKIRLEEILPNSGEKIQASKLTTVDDFLQMVKDDPSALIDLQDLYIIDWPAKKVESQPVAKPPQPAPPKPTPTPPPAAVQQASKNSLTIPAPPTPPAPSPKSTTIITKIQQIGNSPPQKTTTTITSNQQLINPGQNSLNSVLSRFNSPLNKIADASKNGGSSQTNNNQPANYNQKSSTQNTGSTSSTSGSSSSSVSTMREQMRALTNSLRARYGAGSVKMNALLTKIAQDHSNDMVARNFFEHQNPDGESSGDRAKRNGYDGMIGQNLAQAPNVNQAQVGFENSPAHFKNAINPGWEQMGVGVAQKGSLLFITCLFGPRMIQSSKLTPSQIQAFKSQIGQVIIDQSPSIKTVDENLSSIIQQWMDGSRNTQLLQYIVNRGGYRTPMTAATYTVDYSKDFVDRVRTNGYFQNGNSNLRKFGIGMKQIGMKLEIYVIYM